MLRPCLGRNAPTPPAKERRGKEKGFFEEARIMLRKPRSMVSTAQDKGGSAARQCDPILVLDHDQSIRDKARENPGRLIRVRTGKCRSFKSLRS